MTPADYLIRLTALLAWCEAHKANAVAAWCRSEIAAL